MVQRWLYNAGFMRVSRFSIYACVISSVAIGALPLGFSGVHAQEIVQSLPDPAEERLSDALRRLSRNPNSLPSLIAAGRSSLELGDISAAQGFLTRAQRIAPDDGRVLAALATVAVRRGQPATAVQLFTNADRQGEFMSPYAADRGLAYDLVGRNDRAQRYYRQALSRRETPEVIRRLALSYAISGDGDASEAILLPLLQRQDRTAFRTRAFALAILGREDEAVAIAEAMLPARLSTRLAPYLRYMQQLTPSQQAAAANLGRFPAANEVGVDTPAIAALANSDPAPAATPSPQPASQRLEPRGEPLGQPSAAPSTSGELPAIAGGQGAQPAEPVVTQTTAQPSFSITNPVEAEPEPESQPERIELAEAFADFSLAEAPRPSTAGAVDITSIEPRREAPPEPEPEPEPAPPAHPSRHWVQVATGQNTSAFRFDWRRIRRNAGDLLSETQAWYAPWGQTNRLLAGPFDSARAAQAMVSALAGEGVDSFRYVSPEGQEIQSLD